jgi:hypothetical protein
MFSSLVAVGQMVSVAATDPIFYEDTIAWARKRGHEDLVRDLEAIGPSAVRANPRLRDCAFP